ncbi:MAG: hypothetical protein LBV43_03165 [Prevotella sp.]|nr:hypothetical protein [Prevotella sp.]
MSEASLFISKRKHSITENRVKNVLWYVGECYILLINDKVKYSEKLHVKSSTIPFEDYLRNRLVEDYLIKNKNLLKERISELDEINFGYETNKEYIEKGILKPDKIDIYINKLGLNGILEDSDENVYYAIECKRIRNLGDSTTQYINDIVKFSNREYVKRRLPFEGQLGFIELNSITHIEVYGNINDKLNKEAEITTDTPLQPCTINQNISCSYISKHKRNIGNKEQFSIYHLLLDYSDIVIN